MTDAFDVSLRVKLDYQAGGTARAAVGDLEAVRNAAVRLGATPPGAAAIKADVDRLAVSAKANADRMGELDKKLSGFRERQGQAAAAMAAQMTGTAGAVSGVAAEATKAGKAVDALGNQLGAAIKMQRAAGGFKNGAELEAFLKTFEAQAKATEGTVTGLAASADRLGRASGPRHLGDGLDRVASGAAEARREVDFVGNAAAAAARDLDKMGAARGRAGSAGAEHDPVRRAGQAWRRRERSEAAEREGAEAQKDAFWAEQRRRIRMMDRSGAMEARRQRQEERREEAAEREAERAARHQGRAVSPGDEHGAGPGGPQRHAGPGGVRGALIAGARPLHMERILASAMTPTGLMGLGAGLGLAGIAHQVEDATHKAIDLEDAMNTLKRTVGDVSPERMKGLEGEILRTSRATGMATGELAAMAAAASAAGRPLGELPQFMDLGAKAAGALGLKGEEAAEAMTRIGTDFKLDGAGLRGVLDATATLQERTGASGAGTLDFMSRVGPVAGLARMQPAQVAAYGGIMQKLGMSPDQSSGLFGDVLTKLLSGDKGGQGYMTALHKMKAPNGDPESAFALQRLARVDPSAAMVRFLGDVKTLSKERRFTFLSEIVGSEKAEALSTMSEHVDELTRNLGLMQDKGAQRGGLERVFKVFDEATSKKIEHATAALGAFATKMGQHFAPAVGAAADATARFFGGWLDRMDRLKEAGELAEKLVKGIAPAPEQQTRLDADPKLRAQVQSQADAIGTARANDRAASPDPEAGRQREMARMGATPPAAPDADPLRERDRLKLVENIRADDVYARAHGGVGADDARELRAAYAAQFPDKPLPAFAGGGQARGPGGPTGDGILARVSDGEFIVNARSTAKHLGTIKAINDDALPAYATGGAGGTVLPMAARPDDPAAHAKLEGTIAKAVKEGVVAGLRDARDLLGASAGSGGSAPNAAQAADLGEGGSGAHPSLRYGRTPSGGYRMAPGGGGRARGGGGRAQGGGGSGHASEHHGRPPGAPRPHERQDRAGVEGEPNDGAPPGDGTSTDWSAAILRKKEGFLGAAQ